MTNCARIKALISFSFFLLLNPIIAEEENSEKACFRVGDISGWLALGDQRLIVWSPSKSHPFLVTLFNRCPNLRFEDTLIFKSTLWRTCSNYNDEIYTEVMRCSIKNIQALDKDQADILIQEYRNQKIQDHKEDTN